VWLNEALSYPIIEASGWKKALGLVGGLLDIDSYLGHLHLQPLNFGASTNVYHILNRVLIISPSPPKKYENFYKLLPTTNFVFKK